MESPQLNSLNLVLNSQAEAGRDDALILVGSYGRAALLGETLPGYYAGRTRDVDLIDPVGFLTTYCEIIEPGYAPLDFSVHHTLAKVSSSSWRLSQRNKRSVSLTFDEELLDLRDIRLSGINEPVRIISNPLFAAMMVRAFPDTYAKHKQQSEQLSALENSYSKRRMHETTDLFAAYDAVLQVAQFEGNPTTKFYDAAHKKALSAAPRIAKILRSSPVGDFIRKRRQTSHTKLSASSLVHMLAK